MKLKNTFKYSHSPGKKNKIRLNRRLKFESTRKKNIDCCHLILRNVSNVWWLETKDDERFCLLWAPIRYEIKHLIHQTHWHISCWLLRDKQYCQEQWYPINWTSKFSKRESYHGLHYTGSPRVTITIEFKIFTAKWDSY